jgi:hypothetical protein
VCVIDAVPCELCLVAKQNKAVQLPISIQPVAELQAKGTVFWL